jgi:malate dehydrogenase (oxaloacetate-decarboxylating)
LYTPGLGIISKSFVAKMRDDPIVFACVNPIPGGVKRPGARVVATGRSDFPNQLNNSLGFPSIFRGTIHVRAQTVTDEMCPAAASELAKLAEESGLSAKNIIPTMDDWEAFPRKATAVAEEAMASGVARVKKSREELHTSARSIVKRAREQAKYMMRGGFIQDFPT